MSRLPRVSRMEPPGGPAHPRYAGATLLDSFGVRLPPCAPDDAHRLAELALRDPPLAFRAIMALRDGIVTRLGVKTSGQIGSAPDGRERIDFFPVLHRTADEVVLGADDSHLDFRTWLTISTDGEGRVFQSTTAATAHNPLGRAYLALTRPFHVAIVRASLRRAIRRLRPSRPETVRANFPHAPGREAP